jgi:hypothetical protein
MRVLFAQLFVATVQCQLQFTLQLLQVFQFLPHVSQLRLQAAADRRARLHPATAQTQEAPNFAEFESQALNAPDEGQRFDITLTVLAKASLRPGRPRHQRIPLVEANRVNAQSDFFGDDADLHGVGSCREATPWSIVQSQHFLFVFRRIPLNLSSTGTAPMWTLYSGKNPPAERKNVEEVLPQLKARLEASQNQEQMAQAKQADYREQLRLEQAKLDDLQANLERLEKSPALANHSTANNPH